jgi:hypothetical protein
MISSTVIWLLRLASPTNARAVLQDLEAAVLLKVPIEGDGFFDPQPLHDDEALGVAQRVCLVVVGTNQGDGARLISGADAFDAVVIAKYHVEDSIASRRPPRDRMSSREYVSTTTVFVVTRRQRSP